MTEPTTTAAAKTAIKASKDVAEKVLPSVVDTTEIALDIPSKVVLKQPVIVIVSVLAGAALTAGGLFAYNKFRNRNAEKEDVADEMTVIHN